MTKQVVTLICSKYIIKKSINHFSERYKSKFSIQWKKALQADFAKESAIIFCFPEMKEK